jgi:trimethylamine--corrinoid protein Co-methyltransferase
MTNPAIVQPKLTLLSPDQIAQVHTASLDILSTVGVRIDSATGRRILARALGAPADDDRVRIPPHLVEQALASAPPTVDLYDQRGDPAFRLGTGEARFGVGVTALYYQDPKSGQVTPFARRHFRTMVRLGDSLPSFDAVSTVGVIQDLPAEEADLYAALEMAANTTKPLVLLVSDEERFGNVLDLLAHLRGDPAGRPFVIPYFNPITPLVINAGTVDKMAVAIDRGLPLIYSNYAMIGATTPITPAGTLALLNAELLAGLVLSQLMKEGTPVVLGSLPTSFDMRGMGSFYTPPGYLVSLACAEMMAHYGLPHCGTSGSGVGWGPGLVAAGHQWTNHLLAAMGKMEFAPFVGDDLGAKAFSPAIVVYANEVIERARRVARGFAIDEAAIGREEIAQVGPGGTFLVTDRTLALFRDAYAPSQILPDLTLEAWQERGCPSPEGELQRHTQEMIANLEPPADYEELIGRGEAFIRAL